MSEKMLEMSLRLSITSRTTECDIAKIMELGLMERVGGDHGGTWNVIIKLVTALPIGSMR